jgi:SAM-dependent methyltransferase
MDELPDEQKQRVFEIVRDLKLGITGVALDFGCGNGVFTEVVRQARPEWDIYSCDISEEALKNARNRFSKCSFFVADENEIGSLKFDILFSHHVLEHVFDIKKIVKQMSNLLNPYDASALLILPCGNEGSFEYEVSKHHRNGIDPGQESRFFFEDEGHVRRLTTKQTNLLMARHKFSLYRDYYSNQEAGAIQWISQSTPGFILDFANPAKALDKPARKFLFNIRIKLFALFLFQLPSIIYNRIKLIRIKTPKHYLLWLIILFPHFLSYPVYSFVNYLAKKEWEQRKNQKNGSEMYLFYRRSEKV